MQIQQRVVNKVSLLISVIAFGPASQLNLNHLTCSPLPVFNLNIILFKQNNVVNQFFFPIVSTIIYDVSPVSVTSHMYLNLTLTGWSRCTFSIYILSHLCLGSLFKSSFYPRGSSLHYTFKHSTEANVWRGLWMISSARQTDRETHRHGLEWGPSLGLLTAVFDLLRWWQIPSKRAQERN